MTFATSYIRLALNFVGGVVDTSYNLERSTVGSTGPFELLASDLPLLGERAVYIDDTVPIGVPVWWRATGIQSGEVDILTGTQVTGLGFVWMKDPLRPWTDIPFDFCDQTQGHAASGCTAIDPEFIWGGFGDQSWASDAGLFPILNAERPADVFARRKFADGSFTFFTRTLDAIDRIYDLFTAGGPLMLQLPPQYGWDDAFLQPSDLKMSYIANDQRRPERKWDVDFTIVDMPGGPAQGTVCNNWCEIDAAFATYADFQAQGRTYLDLLQGIVLCPPGLTDGFGIGEFGDGPFGDGG